MHNVISACGVTLKIGKKTHERINSPEKIHSSTFYASIFSQNTPIDKSNCIFIDESRFNLHLKRSMPRSEPGIRASVPITQVRERKQQ